MAANNDFFEGIGAQAVLKHGILTRYAIYFAGKVGKFRSLAFIDGYAGEGRYADGNLGSPLLLASSAERAAKFGRNTKLAFVEQDAGRHARLLQSLNDAGVQSDQVLKGSFADSVEFLLDRYKGHGILVFVDPFGLAFDRPFLESILRRSASGQPIDVLFHFSVHSVARMARAELAEAWKGGPPGPSAVKLDAALGDVDWRAVFAASDDDNAATKIALVVAEAFGRSIRQATKVPNTMIEVRQRPDHLPKYALMLFSTLEEAHWNFADQAGVAYVDWLHHCDNADYQAAMRTRESTGIVGLFDEFETEPDRAKVDKSLEQAVVGELREHLAAVLQQRKHLRPLDDVYMTYGPTLGRARAMHVRSALKLMHSEGLINDDCKGDFFAREIRWTGPQ